MEPAPASSSIALLSRGVHVLAQEHRSLAHFPGWPGSAEATLCSSAPCGREGSGSQSVFRGAPGFRAIEWKINPGWSCVSLGIPVGPENHQICSNAVDFRPQMPHPARSGPSCGLGPVDGRQEHQGSGAGDFLAGSVSWGPQQWECVLPQSRS